MEIPYGMCLVCETNRRMQKCIDLTGGGNYYGVCFRCFGKMVGDEEMSTYEFKPVIDDDKILVCVKDGYGNEESWYLTIEEIFQAFDEKYPGRFVTKRLSSTE